MVTALEKRNARRLLRQAKEAEKELFDLIETMQGVSNDEEVEWLSVQAQICRTLVLLGVASDIARQVCIATGAEESEATDEA